MYQPAPTGVAVDPIISRLRPRTVAEVLDQAFRLYRKNFVTFIAILAVVHIPLQLITLVTTLFFVGDTSEFLNSIDSGSTVSSARLSELFSYVGVLYVVILGVALLGGLIQKVSEGALTAGVADSHLDRPVTFGSSYRQMFARIGPMLGLIFLQTMITLVIFVPFFLLIFGFGVSAIFGNSSGSSAAGGGLICFSCVLLPIALVGLAYISVRLTITTPALIIEKLGPIESIRRSWSLMQGFWWRTFALLAVLTILGWVVQAGPGAIVQGIVGIFAPRDLFLQQIISGFVTTFTTLVFLPIQLIAITLYYFDLRVRKEGYDLETALNQRYAVPPPVPGYYPAYGSAYGQTQPSGGPYGQTQSVSGAYGQTQPVQGYSPPQLGTEAQNPYYGYGAYTTPMTETPPPETSYSPPTTPTDDAPPETPRHPEPETPEQS